MIFWHIFLISMATLELQYLLSPHSCIYSLNKMPTAANKQLSFRTEDSISSHKIWHSSQLLNGKSQSYSTVWLNSQHLHICFPTHLIYFKMRGCLNFPQAMSSIVCPPPTHTLKIPLPRRKRKTEGIST